MHRLLRISMGVLLAGAGGFALASTSPPERGVVLGGACHTPARVIEPAGAGNGRTAILFHGLGASEAVMQPLAQSLAGAGWRVYLPDLAGHGASLKPFSYASAMTCAASMVAFLDHTGRIAPDRTIFVGHSLGGAIVLRLADRLPVAATVAISPAPLVLPRRMPSNLLILAGQFDLGPVKKTAQELLAAAGGARTARKDFIERRAVKLRIVSGEMHGSMVLDPRVWLMTDRWAVRAANVPGAVRPGAILQPLEALLGDLALLAGLLLLVGPMETVLARMFFVEPAAAPAAGAELNWWSTLGRWTAAAFTAVCFLGLLDVAVYVRPVRLMDGDWAALVALLTGVLLVALSWKAVARRLRFDARGQAFAAVAAIAVVAAFAVALRPELVEATFHVERIWRWVALVGFTWPYFLAEEAVLGAPAGRGRFLLFLGMRAVVWLAQLFALLAFWQWGLLLVLMGLEFGAVSIGQRLAADTLRRRGAGPTAAALFDAILAAGLLALVLPLT